MAEQNEFGLGLTILDALDTLWLMGMKAEFEDVSTQANIMYEGRV